MQMILIISRTILIKLKWFWGQQTLSTINYQISKRNIKACLKLWRDQKICKLKNNSWSIWPFYQTWNLKNCLRKLIPHKKLIFNFRIKQRRCNWLKIKRNLKLTHSIFTLNRICNCGNKIRSISIGVRQIFTKTKNYRIHKFWIN